MKKNLSLTLLGGLFCTTYILSIFSMEHDTHGRYGAHSLTPSRNASRRNPHSERQDERDNPRERERRSQINEPRERRHPRRTLGSGNHRRDQAISSNTFRPRYVFTRTTVEKVDAPMIDQSVVQEDKSVEVTSENFSQILYIAVVKNDYKKIQTVLSSYQGEEFDPNQFAEKNETPLHRAVRDQRLEIVKVLCADPRIKINTPDDKGETALFKTITPEIIEHLIFNGADPRHKNERGYSPLDQARKLSREDVLISLQVKIIKEKAQFIKQQEEERLQRIQSSAVEVKSTEDTDNPVCSICFESEVVLASAKDTTDITGSFVNSFTCTHQYHENCIKSLIKLGSKRCPLCRSCLKILL